MKKRILLSVLFGLLLAKCCFSSDKIIYSDNFKKDWKVSNYCNGEIVSKGRDQNFRGGFLRYNFTTPGQDAVLVTKKVNIPLEKENLWSITLISDGLKQRPFLVLKDKSGESYFFNNLGRLFSKGERTICLSLEKYFIEQKDIKGDIWGGDGNRLFNSPLSEITLGIDNYPDRVNRKGKIGLTKLEVLAGPISQPSDLSEKKLLYPAKPEIPALSIHNLILNPSFEEGGLGETPPYWRPRRGVLTKVEGGTDGKHCAKWVMNKDISERLGAYFHQLTPLEHGYMKGDVYLFSVKLRVDKRAKISLCLHDTEAHTYSDSIDCWLCPEDGWMHFLIPYQTKADMKGKNDIIPHIYVYQADIPIYVDDARLYKAPEETEYTPQGIGKFITNDTIIPEKFEG